MIFQPGADDRRPPFVVATSDARDEPERAAGPHRRGRRSRSRPARRPPRRGRFTQLARLAMPSGLGDQAPLIGDGIDAVAISSAGERPLAGAAAEDALRRAASTSSAARSNRPSTRSTTPSTSPSTGPDAYLELGDNLLPGWALALLAATLILPALVAAVDACARAARRDRRSAPRSHGPPRAACRCSAGWRRSTRWRSWVRSRGRRFPFDPGLYELGGRAVIAFVIIALAAGRHRLVPALAALRAAGARGRAGALGALAALSCALIWLANPYLALLLAPAAHVWVLAASDRLRGPLPGLRSEPSRSPACCRSPRCWRSRRRSGSAATRPGPSR